LIFAGLQVGPANVYAVLLLPADAVRSESPLRID